MFKKKPFIRYIYFEEYNDWIPYDANKQSMCSAIEEACLRKVYNQLNTCNPPTWTYDTRYRIVFEKQDGDFVNILVFNKKQKFMI
jgi:hypothetical protein